MEIFDFNIHLYYKDQGTIETQITNDTLLTTKELVLSLEDRKSHFLNSGLTGCNFMLFNSNIYKEPDFKNFKRTISNIFKNSTLTLLLDINTPISELEFIKECGINLIKFHSYVQQIEEKSFNQILKLAKRAEELNLPICIDTSYGSFSLYKYNNLKLSAFLAEQIKNIPIILLHSGGARVLEAMLIADMSNNVFLETSLSLNYYKGSNLMNDFAFAFKKIGTNRVLFASDFPYQKVDDSISDMKYFFEHYRFKEKEQANIMYNNALNLIKSLE